jgi:hypothetical protein
MGLILLDIHLSHVTLYPLVAGNYAKPWFATYIMLNLGTPAISIAIVDTGW